jgi:archaellum biogenesis ATPase FlaH
MTDDPSMVAYALQYAKRGLGVFPIWEAFANICTCGDTECARQGKHPIEFMVPHGCLDASTDAVQIRKWWGQRPTANIGILCGKTMFAVDVDPRHGGDESFEKLQAEHGKLPDCVQVHTGGGGRHFYLRVNGTPIEGRIAMLPGIDIKATGGYVLAPPSNHISGKRYEFVTRDYPIAEPPEWLVGLINRKVSKGKFDIKAALAGSPHGQRYYTLIGLAGKLRYGDIPFDVALKLMFESAVNCKPPAPEKDTRRILEKAYATWKPGINSPGTEIKTLSEVTTEYIDRIKAEKGTTYVSTGIGSVDWALGGGIEYGEMVVVAARPSHGKSAFALHSLDASACKGISTAIVSEEMSAMMLGKRTVQYTTAISEYFWQNRMDEVESQLDKHFAERAPCYVLERCKTADHTVELISDLVNNKGVQVVAIDYAQLISGKGSSRYEQITQTSIALRQLASALHIVLIVVCQLNRSVVSREQFIPRLDDIKDSGQLEQDADVVMSLVWPWYLDNNKQKHDYQIFINKNRNRQIMSPLVQCQFDPSRQMFSVTCNMENE